MSSVIDYTSESYIKFIDAADKFSAIKNLSGVFENTSICSNVDELSKALLEREEIMSTGIGFGIAIPHAKIKAVNEMAFAIGIVKEGIDYDSMDGEPVYLIILVAAEEKQHKEYLRLLSNIMSIIKREDVKEKILKAESGSEVFSIIKAAE